MRDAIARHDSTAGGASVSSAHGPLAVERELAAAIAGHAASCRADPALLARPVRIVVPSRSLRLHVAGLCARESKGAIAGIAVTTLFQCARDVFQRAGETPPTGERLFQAFVDSRVRSAPAKWSEIAGLEDGSAAIAATIADLFDAGFEGEHASALLDALSEALASKRGDARGLEREFDRAMRLVQTAQDVARDLGAAGIGRRSLVLRRAAEHLRQHAGLVDASAVWIHGFSDATGAAADLLEALARAAPARIFWDACAEGEFGEGLRARFSIAVGAPRVPQAECTLSRAASLDAEVRAVAVLIRTALDAGVVPESIGVVARDFTLYRARVRTHFGRLAIPFSAHGVAGLDGPAERRARALARLLEAGSEASSDHWFDARDAQDTPREPKRARARQASDYEMRLALRSLGSRRLSTFAALDLDAALAGRPFLRLPMRAARPAPSTDQDGEDPESDSGLEGEALEDARDEPLPASRRSMPRRTVGREDLSSECTRARRWLEGLEHWPKSAAILEHTRYLSEFARVELEWIDSTPGAAIVRAAIATLERELPRDLPLSRDTFLRIAARAIPEHARTPLGGSGGGVQCLEVVEARGRTFERLFVLGLARGRFPRTVREDPLLSDDMRRVLRRVLPDLPLKAVGRDEERVLFDQLVRSAPAVALSWLTLDEEGKALLPSVLLERAAIPAQIAAAPISANVFPSRASEAQLPATPRSATPRPAHEHAVLRALEGGVPGIAAVMPIALAEVRRAAGLDADSPTAGSSGAAASNGDATRVARATEIARGRIAVLNEFEPARAAMSRLGPYFGYVGTLAHARDGRAGDVWVTQLEGVRSCGWRALLGRILGLEAAPDPSIALPELDARTVGNTVHAVLQKLVGGEGSLKLEVARTLTARPMTWPDDASLQRLTIACARAELVDRGIALPGFEHMIAERARGFLAEARALDARERATSLGVIGAEIEGRVPIAASTLGERYLCFRADRVDRVANGLRLSDYKTGKPISQVSTEAKRLAWHHKGIARGTHLQAAAYALAAGPAGSGRYVYLSENVDEAARVFEIRIADEAQPADDAAPAFDLASEFDSTVEAVLATWDLGLFFPRLLNEKLESGNTACSTCELSTACLRGDSTAHQRLAEFIRDESNDDDHATEIRALWSLKESAS
jgi:hypothetical protein